MHFEEKAVEKKWGIARAKENQTKPENEWILIQLYILIQK